jgi:acyl-coenzyme A thioesterase PaaI-like protein
MFNTNLLDKLFRPKNRIELEALDKVMTFAVPFNAPHAFKLLKVTPEEVQIKMPFLFVNKNHVGGMHATAIATLGEYCAGMVLASRLGTKTYRFILSELNTKYFYQGKTTLIGSAQLDEIKIENAINELNSPEGKTLIQMMTSIKDKNHKLVAEVTTLWQLKNWEKVKTK